MGAAAAAASAAAAAAWRRPIHPPAAGRLAAWEGPGAWAARLLRVVARASSGSTNPLPSPPPPPSSSSSSGQPTARPLLEPGSAVVMTPGKHSRAAGAGRWGSGTAGPPGKGRRALVCGSPPCTALRRAPASRLTSPCKFRARSVRLDPRGSQRLGSRRDCRRFGSRAVSRRLWVLWLVRSLSKPRYRAGLKSRASLGLPSPPIPSAFACSLSKPSRCARAPWSLSSQANSNIRYHLLPACLKTLNCLLHSAKPGEKPRDVWTRVE